MEKIFLANGNLNKARLAALISDKIDFKTKTIIEDKEEHYIIINGSIQEYITIVNIYVPNIVTPECIRQMLTDIQGEIDSIIIMGNFNSSLTSVDRSSREKINKETQSLNDTLET